LVSIKEVTWPITITAIEIVKGLPAMVTAGAIPMRGALSVRGVISNDVHGLAHFALRKCLPWIIRMFLHCEDSLLNADASCRGEELLPARGTNG
jgi:hypothetical protein